MCFYGCLNEQINDDQCYQNTDKHIHRPHSHYANTEDMHTTSLHVLSLALLVMQAQVN